MSLLYVSQSDDSQDRVRSLATFTVCLQLDSAALRERELDLDTPKAAVNLRQENATKIVTAFRSAADWLNRCALVLCRNLRQTQQQRAVSEATMKQRDELITKRAIASLLRSRGMPHIVKFSSSVLFDTYRAVEMEETEALGSERSGLVLWT